MIHIYCAAKAFHLRGVIEEARSLLEPVFGKAMHDPNAFFVLLRQEVPVGFLCEYRGEDGIVRMNLWMKQEQSFEEGLEVIAACYERAVKLYLPDKVIAECHEGISVHSLQGCRFFAKGNVYQKILDPKRKVIPASAFDPEGYLIHQGLTANVPFGWFDSKRKGCGWIAAYNLLKINGMEKTIDECIEGLDRNAVLGQVMGQNEALMHLWLSRQGLKLTRSLPSDSLTAKRMKKSRSGILLYTHKFGAHYAAYRTLKDGRIQLYNAVYGRVFHIVEPAEFLKEHALFPFSSLLYVK